MINIRALGWDENSLKEVDHNLVLPPYIRMIKYTAGDQDIVYSYDFRLAKPNKEVIDQKILHSMEHIFLYWLTNNLRENFVGVAPMGCQTGLYLHIMNEGMANKMCEIYEKILRFIKELNTVPYANDTQCGNFKNHDLDATKKLADSILIKKKSWLRVI